MEKIKVLHIISRADVGGISSLLQNYYSRMRQSNIVFHVVAIETPYIQSYQAIFESLGIQFFLMPQALARRLTYILRLLKSEKYHVVHAHVELISVYYLFLSLWVGIRVRIAHTHLAVDHHGIKNRGLREILNRIATHRMGCSKVAIAKLFGSGCIDRAFVLPNAIDPSGYSFNYTVRRAVRKELQLMDKYVVGFVGRLTELKNIPFLLKVFKDLKDRLEDAVLVIVGDGEMKPVLEQEIVDLGIEREVLFLGNRPDVNALMMGMDVLLLPSRSEGFGLVLVEAQAAALKCIAASGRIPKETKLSKYLHFASIEKSPAIWTDLILDRCMSYQREDMTVEIGKHHFDVRVEANLLIEFYNKAVKGIR